MSSRDRQRGQALPPIRDVLGDQLDRSPLHDGPYSVHAMQRALPSPSPQISRPKSTWPQSSGPTLAPIRPATPTSSHRRGHGHPHDGHGPAYTAGHRQGHAHAHAHAHDSSDREHGHAQPQRPAQDYSFNVFRSTECGLVHASASSIPQGILRTTRADAGRRHHATTSSHPRPDDLEDREGKYPCPTCGKRFSRPSSLRTHEVVHSDEKPYECPHPGCGKTFTVPSNMRRHFRKAHENGGSGEEDTDDVYNYGQSSYRHGQAASSSYYHR